MISIRLALDHLTSSPTLQYREETRVLNQHSRSHTYRVRASTHPNVNNLRRLTTSPILRAQGGDDARQYKAAVNFREVHTPQLEAKTLDAIEAPAIKAGEVGMPGPTWKDEVGACLCSISVVN